MKVQTTIRPGGLFLLGAFALLCPFAGCGGGGGTATAVPVVTAASDIKSSPGSAQTNTGGCTNATYAPNFAGLIPTYRWSAFPIKVYFINSGVTSTDGGKQVDLKAAAIEGFIEWTTATNSNVTFEVVSDVSQANVTVHFGQLSGLPTGTDILGLEQSTLYSDNSMKSADVLLNLWPGMTAANIGSFRETSAHEFGHALGLNGHSDSALDVMFAAHSLDAEKTLTVRDVNTLRTDYCGHFTRGTNSARPAGATTTVTNY